MPWLQGAVESTAAFTCCRVRFSAAPWPSSPRASVLARSVLRVAEGGLKASIHRVNWEQAYLPLRQADRAAAKVLVDGAGARIAEGIAALMLLIWLRFFVGGGSLAGHSAAWLNYALLAAAVLWLLLIRALGRRLGSIRRVLPR
jgi:ATP/ADP translocase